MDKRIEEWKKEFDRLHLAHDFSCDLRSGGADSATRCDCTVLQAKDFIRTLIAEAEVRGAQSKNTWTPSLSPQQEWKLHNGEEPTPQWFLQATL